MNKNDRDIFALSGPKMILRASGLLASSIWSTTFAGHVMLHITSVDTVIGTWRWCYSPFECLMTGVSPVLLYAHTGWQWTIRSCRSAMVHIIFTDMYMHNTKAKRNLFCFVFRICNRFFCFVHFCLFFFVFWASISFHSAVHFLWVAYLNTIFCAGCLDIQYLMLWKMTVLLRE